MYPRIISKQPASSMLGIALALAMHSAAAQEQARVISRTAMLQQVLVPSSYCAQRFAPAVYYAPAPPPERSAGGAVLGAIVGGLIGSTVGRGDGRVAAAAIGAATGAVIGDRIDNTPAQPSPQFSGDPIAPSSGPMAPPPASALQSSPLPAAGGVAPIGPVARTEANPAAYPSESSPTPAAGPGSTPAPLASALAPSNAAPAQVLPTVVCQGTQALETRIVGYTVVYEYAGKQYSAQLNRDPGERLPLVITPDPSYMMTAPLAGFVPGYRGYRR